MIAGAGCIPARFHRLFVPSPTTCLEVWKKSKERALPFIGASRSFTWCAGGAGSKGSITELPAMAVSVPVSLTALMTAAGSVVAGRLAAVRQYYIGMIL